MVGGSVSGAAAPGGRGDGDVFDLQKKKKIVFITGPPRTSFSETEQNASSYNGNCAPDARFVAEQNL